MRWCKHTRAKAIKRMAATTWRWWAELASNSPGQHRRRIRGVSSEQEQYRTVSQMHGQQRSKERRQDRCAAVDTPRPKGCTAARLFRTRGGITRAERVCPSGRQAGQSGRVWLRDPSRERTRPYRATAAARWIWSNEHEPRYLPPPSSRHVADDVTSRRASCPRRRTRENPPAPRPPQTADAR